MAQETPAGLDLNKIQEILYNGWLAFRLFWDGRVPLLLKVVPLVGFIYLVSPVDLSSIPCIGIFTLGILDDVAVIHFLNILLFIPLSPPHVVGEHQRKLDVKFARLLGQLGIEVKSLKKAEKDGG